jgi:glycosyltransferase involved in cell wall biosynthesis
VGFVGQLFERKNPLLLIRVLSRLSKISQLKCLFVGHGPLLQPMRDQIAQLGLAERCRLVDFQEDIRPVMNAIDVLVLPSRQESFGLVLIEAAAYGKPAIACRSEGPDEIIVEGETGFVVPQDDEIALAQRIEQLASAPEVRRRLGSAAAERVTELFNPITNTRKLEELFDEVLDGRKSPSSRVPAGASM